MDIYIVDIAVAQVHNATIGHTLLGRPASAQELLPLCTRNFSAPTTDHDLYHLVVHRLPLRCVVQNLNE